MLPPKLTIGPTQALIADLDSTLVDTQELMRQGHHATACHFLAQAGVPEQRLPDRVTYSKYLHLAYGQPATDMLRSVLQLLYPKGTPEHAALASFDDAAMLDYLISYQDQLAAQLVLPEPGLAELMTHLSQQQISLAVVTNCQPYGAMRALSLGLRHCGLPETSVQIYRDTTVDESQRLVQLSQAIATHWALPQVSIVTAAQVRHPKPDPEGTVLALRNLGMHPEQAAYLGDHPIDMRTAQAAGIGLRLGVSTGTSTAAQLQEAGARIVVSTLSHLHFSNTPVMATIPQPRHSPENLTPAG